MALKKKIFDSRTLIEQGQINKALAEKGLGQLHEEGLLDQLAMCVQTHDRFRKLLARTPPEQRQNCYDCLAPRLIFKALPLEDYMSETKELASASVSRMEPVVVGEKPSLSVEQAERIFERAASNGVSPAGVESAQRLIHRVTYLEDEETAKTVARGRLTIACHRRKCITEATVYAMNRADAFETLAAMGWKFEGDKAWCPECAKPLRKNG